MLHAAATSATKTGTAHSKRQLAPLPQWELHPYSPGGLGHAAPGRSGVQQFQTPAGMQRTYGNQAVLRTMQGSPQVARMAALRPSQSVRLQRKCACGASSETEGQCAECQAKDKETLQRLASDQATSATVGNVPPIVHDVLSSPGQLLDTGTRTFMEPRFEQAFSQVRVHTDAKAAESAWAVNALAYTVGRDVVFGTGQYTPGTSEGRKLMAHELTHVVQQRGSASAPHDISSSDDSQEREASSVASAIQTGQSAPINARGSSAVLQRQEDLRLRTPQFPGTQQRQISFFPPGQEPRLHLDISVLRPLFELQGISNLRPVGPPRLLPAPGNAPPALLPGKSPSAGSTLPRIPAADEPNKIFDLDFNLDIEPMSLMGYTLARLGLPLQTEAAAAEQKLKQLTALFSGKQVQDTPLGVRLLSTGLNLLGTTPLGSRIIEQAHLNNVTFIINPSTGTFGLTVQFLIP